MDAVVQRQSLQGPSLVEDQSIAVGCPVGIFKVCGRSEANPPVRGSYDECLKGAVQSGLTRPGDQSLQIQLREGRCLCDVVILGTNAETDIVVPLDADMHRRPGGYQVAGGIRDGHINVIATLLKTNTMRCVGIGFNFMGISSYGVPIL